MINTLMQQPTKEENELIDATSELLNFITDSDPEVQKLEAEMVQSISDLERLHPRYCLIKANLIRAFLNGLKRGGNESLN